MDKTMNTTTRFFFEDDQPKVSRRDKVIAGLEKKVAAFDKDLADLNKQMEAASGMKKQWLKTKIFGISKLKAVTQGAINKLKPIAQQADGAEKKAATLKEKLANATETVKTKISEQLSRIKAFLQSLAIRWKQILTKAKIAIANTKKAMYSKLQQFAKNPEFKKAWGSKIKEVEAHVGDLNKRMSGFEKDLMKLRK